MHMKTKQACAELGVCPNTLRKWANEGKIRYIRQPGGQRLYDVSSVGGDGGKRRVCYCRVSSRKQKDDLERQVAKMRTSSQTMKSSATSAADSTSEGRDLRPFWNQHYAEISRKLWSPTVTDCAASVSSSSNGLSGRTAERSWFSATLKAPRSGSLSATSFPSYTLSHTESQNSASTLQRCRKIRIYPTATQRAKLRQFLGTARYTYNRTVEYLRQEGTKANWMAIRKQIITSLPEWANDTPYDVRSIAVREACIAVQNAKRKYRQTGQLNKVSFRSRKAPSQSIFLRKASISKCAVFPRTLGTMKFAEELPDIRHDCRLVCEYRKWYVVVPVDIEPCEAKAKQGVCSIDPGVRTFLTCYCKDGVVELGRGAWERILSVCRSLDRLQARMSKAKARKKQNMRRAFIRLQFRLKCLKDEMQWKCATFLAKSFGLIVIPPFSATGMSSRAKRRIRSKTVRSMLSLGHSEFRERLRLQCEKYGSRMLLVTEEYTSKTCPDCGAVHERLGGSEVFRCPKCGHASPRDANGARNILLRAMVDSPTQFTLRETVDIC